MSTHQKTKGEQHGYAIFDLDRTLTPWDTPLLFCNFVLKRKPLRRAYLLLFMPLCPFVRIITPARMKRVFLNFLWRFTPQQLDQLAREFLASHFPRSFHPEIIQRLEQEKQSGKLTVLTSASYDFLVRPIAEKLGFDCFYATSLKTGKRIKLFPAIQGKPNTGTEKITNILPLLPDGFDPASGTTLPNSIAYSDNPDDLPLLEMCESACLVNPLPDFKQTGTEHGWEILTPAQPTPDHKTFFRACLRQGLGLYPD